MENEKRTINALMAATLIFLALRMAASFFTQQRLWGLNHAGFFGGLWLVYPALAAAILVYLKSGKLHIVKENARWLRVFPFLTGALFIAAFYFFRVRAHFLGDGLSLISQLADPNVGIKTRELGEMYVHLKFIELFGEFTNSFARFAYQSLSIMAGILFVAGLVFYSRRIFAEPKSRAVFIILSLLLPVTLMYYGYIENYSLTLTSVALMIFASLDGIKNRRKSVMPFILFAIAVFMHTISIVYLPGLVIYALMVWGGRRTTKFLSEQVIWLVAVMIGGFLVLYTIIKLWGPYFWKLAFLPILHDKITVDNYYLLSSSHLLDFANYLLFLCPLLVILSIIRPPNGTEDDAKEDRGDIIPYLAAIITAGSISAFFIEPEMGMARDWDLLSIPMAGVSLAGPLLWVYYFSRTRKFIAFALAGIMVNLAVFIPWLALNVSLPASYQYAVAVMKLDPKHGRAGLMLILEMNNRQGNRGEVTKLRNFIESNYPEIRTMMRARQASADGDLEEASRWLHKAIEQNPAYFIAYRELAAAQIKQQQYDSALENLEIADGLNPYNADVSYNIGLVYSHKDDSVRTRKYWLRAIDYDASYPYPYLAFAVVHYDAGDYDSCIAWAEKAADSLILESNYIMGLAYDKKEDSVNARRAFDAFIEAGGSLEKVPEQFRN